MTYQCQQCGREWDGQAAADNEFFCTRKCGGRLILVDHSSPPASLPPFVRSESLAKLIPRLPSTLALVLDEYNHESEDYQTLHNMCGALEITARFLTIVELADVRARRAEFPENSAMQLLQHLERPTLGSWRVLLDEAVKALPGERRDKQCVLPDLPAYVSKFSTDLGGGKGDPLRKLLPMRNLVAHGGRLSDDTVAQLLRAHTERFEALVTRKAASAWR